MVEDPDDLAREWQAAALGEDALLREAGRVARRQRITSTLTWVYLALCLACALVLLDRMLAGPSVLGGLGALAFAGSVVWMAMTLRSQQRRLAAIVTGTPRGAIEALIGEAEVELSRWIGRGSLVASVVILVAGACMVVPPWLASRGTPEGAAWQRFIEAWLAVIIALALVLIPLAAWRVRVLRRRIAAWRSLEAELAGDADELQPRP